MLQLYLLSRITRGGSSSVLIMIVSVYILRATAYFVIFSAGFCSVASRVVCFVQVEVRSQLGLCSVISDICQTALRGTVVFGESHRAWWPQGCLSSDGFQVHDVQLAYILMCSKDCVASHRALLVTVCSAPRRAARREFGSCNFQCF